MQILILGYSQIVRRRVIPAIAAMNDFTGIDLASSRFADRVSLPKKLNGKIYDSYCKALSNSKADLVYISTVNSAHAELARLALGKGFHVIVDKPAFTSLREAKGLVNLAAEKNLCLAEATVYTYHPQIEKVREVFFRQNEGPTRLTAIFSFPPFKADNFRYSKSLGGGALYDLGPYAVSLGRIFFGEEPKEIHGFVNSREEKKDIETAFSILAKYSKGRSLVGHFGFDTEYRNSINFLGRESCVEIERIFTIPNEIENEIKVIEKNQKRILKAPKADCFAIFLGKVLKSIKEGKCKDFLDSLLSDASVLERLRQAVLKD